MIFDKFTQTNYYSIHSICIMFNWAYNSNKNFYYYWKYMSCEELISHLMS